MSATISISGWNFRNSFIAKTEEALSVADPSDLQWIFSESKKRRSIEHQQKCAYIAIKYTGSGYFLPFNMTLKISVFSVDTQIESNGTLFTCARVFDIKVLFPILEIFFSLIPFEPPLAKIIAPMCFSPNNCFLWKNVAYSYNE